MSIVWVKRILMFIILCLVQVLVFNHILLFGCAIPFVYVYFMMQFQPSSPRWGVLLWGFLLGLCIDIFSNTPGVAAGSMTFLGLLQPYLLPLFIPRDCDDNIEPGIRSMGLGSYTYYTILCVSIYNVTFFTLEAFTFHNWQQWLLCIGGSTALTSVLILVIENLKAK